MCSVLTNSEIQQLVDITIIDAITKSLPPCKLLVSGLVSTDKSWPLIQTLMSQIMDGLDSNDLSLKGIEVSWYQARG